ncbi:metalloenzyme [candidate division KSB1 bacterium]|nr:metalloenzyme [candidate division KSB1 bacterium]
MPHDRIMSVLMIFIDGIGIGEFDKDKNPFARLLSPFFPEFIGHSNGPVAFDGQVVPTDPSMGVKGLPQSATGQTALLTGFNSAQALDRHWPGFPTVTLRKILAEESIFLKLEKSGKKATFANAFSPQYFKRPERSISATTWSVRASNFPFLMIEPELLNGEAISHDLTNTFLSKMGFEVPIRTPETSAEILVRIATSVDFCLFEYFLTDLVGHSQEMDWAEVELDKLNRFLQTVLSQIDLNENLVLLTSDHGNFEDLSVSTHTLNFVPTVLWGKNQKSLADQISRIEDVPKAILGYLK